MFHSRTPSVALVAFFLGAFFVHLHAQGTDEWERLQIPARDVANVWSGEGVLAAKKATGAFMFSSDDGETWAAPQNFSPWNVHFGENGHVVAASFEGLVMFSSDNGQSFTRTHDLLPFTRPAYMLGNGDHVLLGQQTPEGVYQYYRSDDGGATWSDFAPKTARLARTIAADGSYYSYEEQSKVYRYSIAKNDWESVGEAPGELYTLVAGSDNRLYGITLDGKLYRSTVGDASLVPYMPDLTVSPYAGLPVSASGEVYAVEKNSRGTTTIYKILDGGSEVVNIPVPLTAVHYVITTDDAGDLLASVEHASVERTYRYDDDNGSWEMLSIDGYGTMRRLDISQNGEILALTKDGLYLSQNNGEQFRYADVPEEDVHPIRDAVLFGSQGVLASRLDADFRSTDKGVSWTKIEQGNGEKLFRDDNGVLYSYYSFRIFRSTDDGLTWEILPSVNPLITLVSGSGDYLYMMGGVSSMHYSTDGGTTWMDMPSIDEFPTIRAAAVLTDGTFIGGAGEIAREIDVFSSYVRYQPGDQELSPLTLPCDRLNSEYLFAADANGKAYLAGVCGLYRSDDGGRSWKWLAHLPTESTPTDLQVTDAGDAYLGTEDGLFRLAQVSSVDDHPSGFTGTTGDVALEVLPNPLPGAGTLRFVLQTPGPVQIDLYDQLGRKVRSIASGQYEAGVHEVELEALQGIGSGSF